MCNNADFFIVVCLDKQKFVYLFSSNKCVTYSNKVQETNVKELWSVIQIQV